MDVGGVTRRPPQQRAAAPRTPPNARAPEARPRGPPSKVTRARVRRPGRCGRGSRAAAPATPGSRFGPGGAPNAGQAPRGARPGRGCAYPSRHFRPPAPARRAAAGCHGDVVARPAEPAWQPGRGAGGSWASRRRGAAQRGRGPGPTSGQPPQHGGPCQPSTRPQGAALLRGLLPAAGPDRGGHDWCLAWYVPRRYCLGKCPAVQRAPPLHDHRPDLPAGRRPAGLPRLQERGETHHQSPARAAARLRLRHRLGLVAVFEHHRKKGYADLYSLHSWCGILAFALFAVQWLVGFSFFLFPGASFSLRSRYRPQHVFFGAAVFLLSVAAALLGLKEALLFELGTKYSMFEPEGVLANVLGLLLVAFATVVLYILTRADWKRPLQAEEQALSMDFKTLTEGDSPSSQ
ncbi:translation initiation factor IF-2 [Moschus berezovskii]|uniref:translation initiation factor IF-2 n=1 Tax=Moschus berezovskii TaxID=68408 RepID=UPI0024451FE4|nr:translation initiation factor IF-2 [Moschus berezovskii]